MTVDEVILFQEYKQSEVLLRMQESKGATNLGGVAKVKIQ